MAQHSALAATTLPRYIDEYSVPTPNSAPLALTVDPDGIVWFTESNASKLGRFDPRTDTFTEYAVPGVGDMWGITVDQKGAAMVNPILSQRIRLPRRRDRTRRGRTPD